MKAVILAAGKGKRMRPLTLTTPKALLKFSGKRIIDHIFDALPKEVNEVVLVIGYLGARIKKYLGNSYKGRSVRYVIQDPPRGTAHALLRSKAEGIFTEGERFLVIYGDELPKPGEIKECLSKPFTTLAFRVTNPSASAVMVLNTQGRILEIIEKPPRPVSDLVAAGVMVVDTNIFKYRPRRHPDGEYYLSSMLNQFLKDYPVYAVLGPTRASLASPQDLEG